MLIGDIVLYSGNRIGSKLIRWVLGSRWSHGYIYKGNPAGTGEEYLEAAFSGVGVTLRQHYHDNTDGWVVIRCSDPDKRKAAVTRATNLIGKHYDWVNYPRLLLKAVWRRVFGVRKSPVSLIPNQRWYCFELLGYAYEEPWVFGSDIVYTAKEHPDFHIINMT